MPAIKRLLINATAIAVGVVVLTLAIPRTVAEFSLLTVEPIRQSVLEGKPVDIDELEKLHDTQTTVLKAKPSAYLLRQKSLTELMLARTYPKDRGEHSDWFNAAEATVEQSLIASPGHPYAWNRLTYLRLRGGEDNRVKDPLVMSVLMGPREEPLLFSRIRYAIRIWDYLSEEDIALIEDQILWADRMDRKKLIAIARRNRQSMMIVFAAMARDLNQFTPFIRAFNQ